MSKLFHKFKITARGKFAPRGHFTDCKKQPQGFKTLIAARKEELCPFYRKRIVFVNKIKNLRRYRIAHRKIKVQPNIIARTTPEFQKIRLLVKIGIIRAHGDYKISAFCTETQKIPPFVNSFVQNQPTVKTPDYEKGGQSVFGYRKVKPYFHYSPTKLKIASATGKP